MPVVFYRDEGFNQEKATTLDAYICQLIGTPEAMEMNEQQFLMSKPLQGLIEGFGLEKIQQLVRENWPELKDE